MIESQLNHYGSWASIIGLAISIISLVYIRNVKASIIMFRRKQRIKNLIEEIRRIPDDAIPLAPASIQKLAALKRNFPAHFWFRFTEKGKAILEVHKQIDSSNIVALKEALNDLTSYSEEI